MPDVHPPLARAGRRGLPPCVLRLRRLRRQAGRHPLHLQRGAGQVRCNCCCSNFGILSSRRPHKDGCWHVHVAGRSAEVFERRNRFRTDPQAARPCAATSRDTQWFKQESCGDEVVVDRARPGRRVRHLCRGHASLRRPRLRQPQQLLAQHPDDQALRRSQGDHRLRRPPQRHRPYAAGEFQSVQDRHRAVPRHRGPLEQGQVRQGIRGGRQPRENARSGTRAWAWAARRSSRSGGSTTT